MGHHAVSHCARSNLTCLLVCKILKQVARPSLMMVNYFMLTPRHRDSQKKKLHVIEIGDIFELGMIVHWHILSCAATASSCFSACGRVRITSLQCNFTTCMLLHRPPMCEGRRVESNGGNVRELIKGVDRADMAHAFCRARLPFEDTQCPAAA